jgi:uncharacterized membrane protein YgdD (TMEM256/DUF423 family)
MLHSAKLLLIIGGANAALVVVLGAFGAHALKARLTPEMMATYQTAIQYHLFHALGLLIIGLLALSFPTSVYLRWAGWLMFAGIMLFSGSLYLLSLSGVRWLGAITPLGGTAFIAAWVLFCLGVLKS